MNKNGELWELKHGQSTNEKRIKLGTLFWYLKIFF